MTGAFVNVDPGKYEVQYQLCNDWGSGFSAEMRLTNTGNEALEDWIISFDFNREITLLWNGIIEEHTGNHYVIRSAAHNSNIAAWQSVSFGFNGEGGEKETVPENITLRCAKWVDEEEGDAFDEEKVEIAIDKTSLKEDELLESFLLTDEFKGLSGTLSDIKNVKDFFYEIKDLRGNYVEGGTISIAEQWEINDIGFTIGTYFIVLTAITKSDSVVQASIEIFNTRIDKLSSNMDTEDDDEDGLPNYIEDFFGTDRNNRDTDLDKLSDYEELMIFGTDPLLPDTDNNGIMDSDEDFDEDGLSNLEELKNNTDPFSDDTDMDGLRDGDEIYVYFTDPLLKDTDDDKVLDGEEVRIHTDPLVKNEKFHAIATAEEEGLKVSVETVLSGEQYNSLTVARFEDAFLFPEEMPGYIGGAYNFYVDGTFDKATLRYEFDTSLNEKPDFDPVIYYFNEEDQFLEELPTTITGNVASAEVTHFSKYILLDRNEFEKAFEWRDEWPECSTQYPKFFAFLLENSNNINNIDRTSEGWVKFWETYPDNLRVNGSLWLPDERNGNMYSAILDALSLFETDDSDISWIMFIFTDDIINDKQYHGKTLQQAKLQNLKIFPIGINNPSSTTISQYLEPLAKETGGEYCSLEDAYKIVKRFEVDIWENSDTDSIPDYYEENMVMFNGMPIEMNKYKGDSDDDTRPDDEEIEVKIIYNSKKNKKTFYGKVISRPDSPDGDMDGIPDIDDPKPLEHFGKTSFWGQELNMFEISDKVENPRNSYIEQEMEWASDGHTYREAFLERAKEKVDVENEMAVKIYLKYIETRAYILLNYGDVYGDLFSLFWTKRTVYDDKIVYEDVGNLGYYLLLNFLEKTDKNIQFDASKLVSDSKAGKEKYEEFVTKAMRVCENGVKENKSIIFKQTDAGAKIGSNYVTEVRYSFSTQDKNWLNSFEGWIALNQAFAGLSGECSYDGEFYNMELTYFLQDYYDWYYPEKEYGENTFLIVTCDEMAWLHLFDMAENFNVLGIYRVNIKWRKGENLSDAKQEPHKFYIYQER